MRTLTVLFESRCGLCVRCRRWLEAQLQLVPLEFLEASSLDARLRFPELNLGTAPEELLAISDDGGVYRGDSAWLMCLWALRDYRPWAKRLARPALRPLVRRACGFFSSHRYALSRVLGLGADAPRVLRAIQLQPEPLCDEEAGHDADACRYRYDRDDIPHDAASPCPAAHDRR